MKAIPQTAFHFEGRLTGKTGGFIELKSGQGSVTRVAAENQVFPTRTFTLALILVLFPASVTGQQFLAEGELASPKNPVPIRQGPLFLKQQSSATYYWYQVGALGTSSSYNFTGANITIRTVYDGVNNDAHSYWVGGYLSNGAFIQVGYLNGLSTTGQAYCCAWFFEYFPAGQSCCDPVIGREDSAGPIGSWHTYSMVHTGGEVWSFYMDGKLLGATPPIGATNSGQQAPAGIAEVAQATSNGDVLGPGEFKDMRFRNISGSWQPVSEANNLIWYGKGTPAGGGSYPNPYGVREVNSVDNNFLAGSGIPPLSSPADPPGNPLLWPVTLNGTTLSVVFRDVDQQSFAPEWVSFRSLSSTGFAFYTDSRDYQTLTIASGTWIVDKVMWHTVNVVETSTPVTVPGSSSLTVQTTVSSLKVRVVGSLFGLPVGGATTITFLPDTTNATAKTDSSGTAVLLLLPPSTYYLRITVPYGIPGIISHDVPIDGEATARVIGLAEMLTIIIAPIAIAVLVTILAIRRERLRVASMPTIPPFVTVTGNCPKCGTALHANYLFCPNCMTPVIREAQPPQSQSTESSEQKTSSGTLASDSEKPS